MFEQQFLKLKEFIWIIIESASTTQKNFATNSAQPGAALNSPNITGQSLSQKIPDIFIKLHSTASLINQTPTRRSEHANNNYQIGSIHEFFRFYKRAFLKKAKSESNYS